MQREWTNIDVLRMEKFLLLVRRYLGATFKVLREEKWEVGLVGKHMGLLEEIPLEREDPRIPNGMRFHIVDIYVDELERVGGLEKGEEGESGVPLEMLLEPLRRLAKGSPTKPVRIKAKEALADERLPGNEKPEKEAVEEDGWAGIQD
jgi:ribosomal RNA-processing protein 1